jgi:outer membrane protein assembly factor BamB
MKRAFIFTTDAIFALYLIIIILSALFLLSYQPTVHIEQAQNIAEDVMAVMGEYKAGYAQGKSIYPYTNYLLNNGRNSSDWLMFHSSLTHDGYTNSTAPNTNLTFWSINLSGSIFSSPAVYDGVVFISLENSTYAIDEATGIIIWSVPIGTNSSPAITSRGIFIGATDNKTYLLDRFTGETIWNASTNGPIPSSPAIHSGKVFIGSSDGIIYSFDENSGVQLWSQITGGAISSSPAVADEKVFISSKDSYLYALNEIDGSIIWKYPIASGPDARLGSSPAVAYGKVFIGSPEGMLAINESTGTKIWNNTAGPIYSSSPAVAYGKVVIGTADNRVYAFNESTGTKIWEYNTTPDSINYSSPAVADRKIFIGTDTGNLLALNEANGNLIWRYSTGSGIQSSPAIAGGRVYFGDVNGTLYSLGDCSIENLNKTVMELIGEFWSINKPGCSANLFQDIFQVGHVATYSNKLLLRFNEGSGSVTVDVMNSNNGVLNNSPDWTTGKIGKGLQFNGINQSVSVRNSPSLNNFTNLTMEAWFKTNDTQNKFEYIICKLAGTTCSYGMFINPGLNAIGFSAGPFSVNQPNPGGGTFNVSDGNWHHLAVVIENLTGGIKGTVYLDGVMYMGGFSPFATSYTTEPLYVGLGRMPGQALDYFNGTVDEVAIYNETKTLDEIKRDYLIEGVIPSRYGFELAIEAGSEAVMDCSGNSNWIR